MNHKTNFKDMVKHNKKKQLGAFVKLNAGDVEKNQEIFNNSTNNSTVSESTKTPLNIVKNIEKELLALDAEDYRDLTNMYEVMSNFITPQEKQTLVNMLINPNIDEVEEYLNDLYSNYDEDMRKKYRYLQRKEDVATLDDEERYELDELENMFGED